MSSAGEPVMRAMSAETMKMPEPIMEPMTSVVALVRPRPFTNSLSPDGCGGDGFRFGAQETSLRY